MARRGNKKKKGRNKTQDKRDVRQVGNGRSSARNYFSHGSPNQVSTEAFAPNFDAPNFEAFQSSGKVLPDNYRTMYSLYKAATARVVEYLQEIRRGQKKDHLTQGKDESMAMTVNSLIETADWMNEAQIHVDPDILKDLKCAIRARSKVAKSVYGGGDSGHQYLLDTLIYCWNVLDSLPRAEKKTATCTREKEDELDNNGEGSSNRFEVLQEIGELEGEDDSIGDEEIFGSQDVPRPTLDGEPVPIEDFLDSEDSTDAGMFLLTLRELMRCVADEYARVALFADTIAEVGICDSAIVPFVLRATIATNMAIQRVQRLEIEFELQNPHISTPYRLLSLAVFPDMVKDIVQVSLEHGGKVCSARDANLFLGDCLECTFRSEDDPASKGSGLLSKFCSRFEIDSKGSEAIDTMYNTLRCLTVAEVPLKHELEFLTEIDAAHVTHGWLPPEDFKYIAGDRSIFHTIRLLQTFGYYAKQSPKGHHMIPTPGSFGPSPWQRGNSNKIHNDLDELLMADILPNWVCYCRDWILREGSTLPRQSELCPLWGCFRRFVRAPDKPVKWSAVFAVHAMLTGILETDKTVIDLASVCQESFDSYFDQLDIACKHKKGVVGSFDSSIFQGSMRVTGFLQSLGLPAFGSCALWNPVCAGTSMLYLQYQGNIEFGFNLMDDRCQLKIVLHLYHALVVNGILQREDIPFLDEMYRGFEKSQVLWGGSSLPRKGKLVEQFWMSMGDRYKVDEKMMAKLSCLDGTKRSDKEHLRLSAMLSRSELRLSSGKLKPEEFSTSYRRICLRDYHDVEDRYFSKEILAKTISDNDYYTFAVQFHDTMEAHANDSELFGYNFAACGVYLDEFVCGMSRFLEWDRLWKGGPPFHYCPETQGEHPERVVEEYMFAYSVLGTLDQTTSHKDPFELDRIKDFVTGFMRPFFYKLSNEKQHCISWIPGIHHDWTVEL